jgi:hypothetical protein
VVPPPRRREPDRPAAQGDGAATDLPPGNGPGANRAVGSQANGIGHRVS